MLVGDAVPGVTLNDGAVIPQFGFGVYHIDPVDTSGAVASALANGYRHVDTSMAYGNEAEVGRAIREAGVKVFVTTKYFNADPATHGFDDARVAFESSLNRLGLERIDLYLIHWPMRTENRYVQTWKAFVELRDSPRLGSIGVSNFQADHLGRIVDETGVTPAVNQIEVHPYFQQTDLRRVHAERGMATEAWGPLAEGKVIDDPLLTEIGKAHEKTAAQVVLRWHIQLGNIVFPKSVRPERVRQNIDIFDFSLSPTEMAAIEGLDRGERIGPDPATFDFPATYRGRAHT